MGYIAGVVTDAGVAVAGANVRAHRLDTGALTTTTTTDAAGLFVFSALVTGDEYTIVAHDPAGGPGRAGDGGRPDARRRRQPSPRPRRSCERAASRPGLWIT